MERAAQVLPLLDELMSLVRVDLSNRGQVVEIIDSIGRVVGDRPFTAADATLRVRCLGQFAVRGMGAWIDGPRLSTARQLIAYLTLHRRSATPRHVLMEKFWPGCDDEGLAHRLHLAASSARTVLKQALGESNPILCVNGGYALQPSLNVESDVEMLLVAERSDDTGILNDAMALYRGEFLAGEMVDWVQPLRVRCASVYSSILERLGRDAYAAKRFSESLALGLELVALDQAYEGATRLVMHSFAALGRPLQAQLEYEKLDTFLKKRLNAEPTPETRAALREIVGSGHVSSLARRTGTAPNVS